MSHNSEAYIPWDKAGEFGYNTPILIWHYVRMYFLYKIRSRANRRYHSNTGDTGPVSWYLLKKLHTASST